MYDGVMCLLMVIAVCKRSTTIFRLGFILFSIQFCTWAWMTATSWGYPYYYMPFYGPTHGNFNEYLKDLIARLNFFYGPQTRPVFEHALVGYFFLQIYKMYTNAQKLNSSKISGSKNGKVQRMTNTNPCVDVQIDDFRHICNHGSKEALKTLLEKVKSEIKVVH